MIDKEVAELRRRYRQDRSNITKIHGCYVNVHGELVSAFTHSMGLLPEGEQEKYLELLKKGIRPELLDGAGRRQRRAPAAHAAARLRPGGRGGRADPV